VAEWRRDKDDRKQNTLASLGRSLLLLEKYTINSTKNKSKEPLMIRKRIVLEKENENEAV
jgi:hypothetical protein